MVRGLSKNKTLMFYNTLTYHYLLKHTNLQSTEIFDFVKTV